MLLKPSINEYPEYYARYINNLPDSGILDHYEKQTTEVLEILKNMTENQLQYKYAANKWSVIEVFGHLIDLEIIMAYRALRYARQDQSNLHMYDHDKYVETGFFNNIESSLIINHFSAIRNSNISLFKTFTNEMWLQKGLTGGKEFTTRAIPYIIVGHTNHHISVIK